MILLALYCCNKLSIVYSAIFYFSEDTEELFIEHCKCDGVVPSSFASHDCHLSFPFKEKPAAYDPYGCFLLCNLNSGLFSASPFFPFYAYNLW